MHLSCLKCKTKYDMPYIIMKLVGYREYSYCNICYKEKEGKNKSLIGRMFTMVKTTYRTLE